MKHKLVTAVAGVMLCAALLGGCGAQGGADMKGERTPTDEQLMSSGYTFDSDYSDYVSDTPGLINPFIVGVDQDKFENEAYSLLEKSRDIYLYGCEKTLPFGYVAPVGYGLPEGYENQGIRLQNQMIKDLGIEETLFEQAPMESVGDDVKITADRSGIHYAILTASGTSDAELVGGSLESHSFSDLKNGSILYLGWLEEGESVTLTNGDEEDETPKISADAYVCNMEALDAALNILSEQHMENVVYDSRNVRGSLKLQEAGRLILSIPYEKGWLVSINGQETEPQLFGGTLMAFDLEAGEYTIEMHYTPAGQYAGMLISVVSIAAFALVMYAGRKRKRAADVDAVSQ